MVGGVPFAQVPLLRNSDMDDPSEWYVGPESERSSIFEFFDRYYELKGKEMDKHVMIVRFLDNMTYMVMNYLQVLEQCPGDKFEKAIAVLEAEYGTLMHNFLAGEAKERDSEVLKIVRGVFEKVDLKILELKKEKLGRRLQEGYSKRFSEAKATQKNLSVIDTAFKMKESMNQQATGIHEFLLRGFNVGRINDVRPEKERMTLDQMSEGVSRGNLDKDDRFDERILGQIIRSYAKNLNDFFPRVNEQNQTGKIHRFNEHFEAGRLDANVTPRVDSIIGTANVSPQDREKCIKIANILNGMNMAYALQADLLLDLERYGSVGMLATGELEFRQANILIIYQKAMNDLKALVKDYQNDFFPLDESKKIRTIPPSVQALFGLNQESQVNKAKNMTLPEFLAATNNNIQIFQMEMNKKIQAIVGDDEIEKVPQFTQNSGSYMSELAVMCTHDPALFSAITSEDYDESSKAHDRIDELTKKVALLKGIKQRYAELNKLHRGLDQYKINSFKDDSIEQRVFVVLHQSLSFFNFNYIGNLESITAQKDELDRIIKILNNASGFEISQDISESDSPFLKQAKLIYTEMRQIRAELSSYLDNYGYSVSTEQQYNQRIEILSSESKELREGLASARKDLEELQRDNLEMEEKIGLLEKQVKKISSDLEQASETNSHLKGELETLQRNVEERDKLIEAFTFQFTSIFTSTFQRQVNEIKSIQQEIKENKDDITPKYKESLLRRLDDIKQAMQEDFDKISKLVKEYQEKLAQSNTGEKKILDKAFGMVTELEALLNSAKETVEQLKVQVVELQQVVSKQKSEIKELQERLAEQERVRKENAEAASQQKQRKKDYKPMNAFISKVMDDVAKRYKGTDKHRAMEKLQVDIQKMIKQGGTTFDDDINKLFCEFIAIAMQSRSGHGLFSKRQTTTGDFVVEQFNQQPSLRGYLKMQPDGKVKYKDIVDKLKENKTALDAAVLLLFHTQQDQEKLTVVKRTFK